MISKAEFLQKLKLGIPYTGLVDPGNVLSVDIRQGPNPYEETITRVKLHATIAGAGISFIVVEKIIEVRRKLATGLATPDYTVESMGIPVCPLIKMTVGASILKFGLTWASKAKYGEKKAGSEDMLYASYIYKTIFKKFGKEVAIPKKSIRGLGWLIPRGPNGLQLGQLHTAMGVPARNWPTFLGRNTYLVGAGLTAWGGAETIWSLYTEMQGVMDSVGNIGNLADFYNLGDLGTSGFSQIAAIKLDDAIIYLRYIETRKTTDR